MTTAFYLEIDNCEHCHRSAYTDLLVGIYAGGQFVWRAYGADDGPYRHVLRSRRQWVEFVKLLDQRQLNVRMTTDDQTVLATRHEVLIQWLELWPARDPNTVLTLGGGFIDDEGQIFHPRLKA